MSEELNIGDYVRTKYGEIRKVVKSTDDVFILDDDILEAHKDSIVKSSPNIIDLIEVGDYVNGHRVEEIDFESETLYTESEYYCGSIDFDMITSIVTKEQFESMEYKIGE